RGQTGTFVPGAPELRGGTHVSVRLTIRPPSPTCYTQDGVTLGALEIAGKNNTGSIIDYTVRWKNRRRDEPTTIDNHQWQQSSERANNHAKDSSSDNNCLSPKDKETP
ncbi:unnamed protein product, partial [Ectocarpus sp. 13 AM-2016]